MTSVPHDSAMNIDGDIYRLAPAMFVTPEALRGHHIELKAQTEPDLQAETDSDRVVHLSVQYPIAPPSGLVFVAGAVVEFVPVSSPSYECLPWHCSRNDQDSALCLGLPTSILQPLLDCTRNGVEAQNATLDLTNASVQQADHSWLVAGTWHNPGFTINTDNGSLAVDVVGVHMRGISFQSAPRTV
ncbi:uncharacterized protein PFL1_05300 [Pseudozyma flocculosa PF-1]|uniref:Uncharacterized protein n=1 Tax=Pseudozyma flocculosa PF-1 TaxID=1277687 RepID=A0A061H8X9_9BASI|nr:uncharacterized protein PFL1_05300 [Pseudozyma flocculosa PF-1]EPQ27016.1 hypothetical protein PFL1_05300 [Pseudozyma flocculosa PF-1]